MAARYYRKAADQGAAFGYYNVAICYGNGEGVEKSFTEAAFWIALAVQAEPTKGDWKKTHDKVWGTLRPAQQASIRERVKAWKPVKTAN